MVWCTWKCDNDECLEGRGMVKWEVKPVTADEDGSGLNNPNVLVPTILIN